VLRASADWQIYERHRTMYGTEWDAWHTVEGPFVVARAGKYYCFYSGGSWLTPHYGVGVGVADSVLGPYRELRRRDGPAVLRTVPGKVIGPGHNSVTSGPDEHTLFMVYHAWDAGQTARRMCIDPLVWTADGPRCLGPTTGPQELELHGSASTRQ
jgi:GH43 family beta-xylosidase